MNVIQNSEESKIIVGTSDADSIVNKGRYATIEAGAGDDKIQLTGTGIALDGSNYDDGAGDSNAHIFAGEGNDTIISGWFSTNMIVDAGSGNNYIKGTFSGSIINAGEGHDTLQNSIADCLVDLGDGNNLAILTSGIRDSTITTGVGNDSIFNKSAYGQNSLINSGAGNDTISFLARSGKSRNAVHNVIEYSIGDGNDIVTGYTDGDTIHITSGKVDSSLNSGNDILLNIGNGSITLKDARKTAVTVVQNGQTSTNETNIINLTEGNDNYENSDKAVIINGLGGNDSISNLASGVIINGGTGSDTISIGVAAERENRSKYDNRPILTPYTKSTASTVDAGDGDDLIKAARTDNLINGAAGNDTIIAYHHSDENLTLTETIYGGAGDDSIDVVLDSNITIDGGGDNDYIRARGSYGINTETMYNKIDGNVSMSGGAGNDTIYLDEVLIATIDAGTGNDSIEIGPVSDFKTSAKIHNDKTLFFNYADGDGNDTIIGYGAGSGAGYDSNVKRVISITSGTISRIDTDNDRDTIIHVGNGSIRLRNSINETINYRVGGGAIQSTVVSGSAGAKDSPISKTITDEFGSTVFGGSNNDYIMLDNTSDMTIHAGAGDDRIDMGPTTEDNKYTRIYYKNGDGNDTIGGGYSSDKYIVIDGTTISKFESDDRDVKLYIGDGSITIRYAVGKEIVYHYTNESYSHSKVVGANETIIAGSSSGSDNSGTSSDTSTTTDTSTADTSTGTETTTTNTTVNKLPTGLKYNSSKTQITVGTKFKSDVIDLANYAPTVKTVKATSFKKSLTIHGNDLSNTITAGKKPTALYGEEGNDKLKGGSGADTLAGGVGNDTLTGGNGKDIFVYDGQGSDVITDYKAGQDSIMIEDEIDSVTVKGKNVIFNVGDGQLTVKGGKSKKITLVDADGNTISNDKYTKSTKAANFVETDYWFAADDNLLATTDIDSMIETESNAIAVDCSVDLLPKNGQSLISIVKPDGNSVVSSAFRNKN
ncbi:MAG: hypothetical protein IJ563_06565 [Selenomonadaceae bacterium]|nr:hypothetical protein [Selenomonadaceae bacterium]